MTEVTTIEAQSRLKSFIERVQNLEEEKAEKVGDIKLVYDEMRSEGYDVKIIKKIIRDLKKDRAKREEDQTVYELYLQAIGEL